MGKKRRTFTGEFKLKVASEALAGERTIQAIAAENDITVSLVGSWKKILQQEGPRFFNENQRSRRSLVSILKSSRRKSRCCLKSMGRASSRTYFSKKKLKIQD